MIENWKPLFNGKYEVSDHGNVRSLFGNRGCKRKKPYIMMKHEDGHPKYRYGHQRILFRINKKKVRIFVHLLVLEAFKGPRPTDKHKAAHNDGNPRNNHVDNLRWATLKENTADRYKHETMCIGEKNGRTKFTKEDILKIRSDLENGATGVSLAKKYGVTSTSIYQIKHRKSWSHI